MLVTADAPSLDLSDYLGIGSFGDGLVTAGQWNFMKPTTRAQSLASSVEAKRLCHATHIETVIMNGDPKLAILGSLGPE